jgi:cytochrome c
MRPFVVAALFTAACGSSEVAAPPLGVGGAGEGGDGGAGEAGSGGAGEAGRGGGGGAPQAPPSVLLFTRTLGYRHPSIDVAVPALTAAGEARDFTVTHTEETFTAEALANIDVVVFLLTTGEVLEGAQQAAFADFIHAGGGFVGVHSATDTLYNWPFYGELVGAYFVRHWSVIEARLVVEDHAHPSTQHLGPEWLRTDEWYTFDHSPRADVTVLLSLDEAAYAASGAPAEFLMGDHPVAWHHEHEGGRAFYTALGHTDESWAEPAFVDHVIHAIGWAAARD